MNDDIFKPKTYHYVVQDENGKYKFITETAPGLTSWQKKIAKWFIETTMPS